MLAKPAEVAKADSPFWRFFGFLLALLGASASHVLAVIFATFGFVLEHPIGLTVNIGKIKVGVDGHFPGVSVSVP